VNLLREYILRFGYSQAIIKYKSNKRNQGIGKDLAASWQIRQ
jgi:hypothetical protein